MHKRIDELELLFAHLLHRPMLLLHHDLFQVLLLVLNLSLLFNELLPEVLLFSVQVKEDLHVLVEFGLLLVLDDLRDFTDFADIGAFGLDDTLLVMLDDELLLILLVSELFDGVLEDLIASKLQQVEGFFMQFLGFKFGELIFRAIKFPIELHLKELQV